MTRKSDLTVLVRPIAHRGLHDKANGRIENTASAFEAAIAKGFGIECDLQPAAGLVPMVFHDSGLHRLTEHTGPLCERTPAQLRRVAMRGTRDRILTLAEMLELVAGRVPVLIEIKSDWSEGDAFAHAIAPVLAGYRGPHALMSFDPRRVRPFVELLPNVPRGVVAGGVRTDIHVPAWLRRWSAHDILDNPLLKPDFVAYYVKGLAAAAPSLGARPKGMPLFTWTVRSEADRRAATRYADAMIFEGFEPEPPSKTR